MYVESGQPFEAVYADGTAGLVPGIEVAVFDGDGNIAIGPTSADITEEMVGMVGTGVYTWNAPAAPVGTGQYSIIWSRDGTWNAQTNSTADELVVVAIGSGGTLPPLPPPVGAGVGPGPCTAWTTSLAIAQCKGVVNSNAYDDAIAAASEILYELSARRFPGVCERTVRPCQTSGTYCGVQILSRGYVINWGWRGSDWGFDCGCTPLSYVELPGRPVNAITEVKIDNVVLDPSEYRLDQQQYLVRLNGNFWPACQRLDLDDTELGTWSVSYTYGQAIPLVGQMAARDLAYEIYLACGANGEGECELPEGVTRVTRQGITYELPAFVSWGRDFNGVWNTGIRLVDAFLNAYNPKGLQRRPILYVPGAQKQARRVGN